MRIMKITTVLCALLLTTGAVFVSQSGRDAKQSEGAAAAIVTPNGTFVSLSIANTEETRARGLGGRDALGENEGMLFVFERSGYHGIWMKGMRFPLDIVWLDETLRVADLREQVSPETYPEVFHPKEPAYYVLELAAGAAAKHDIRIGSVLTLQQ